MQKLNVLVGTRINKSNVCVEIKSPMRNSNTFQRKGEKSKIKNLPNANQKLMVSKNKDIDNLIFDLVDKKPINSPKHQ